MFPDLEMPVATIGHLLAVKVLARDDVRRPQDVIDIRALAQVATDSDRATSRRSVALVMERGYHRDRDPLAELEEAL